MYVINTSGIASFKISSNNSSALNLPAFNDKTWSIKIYNGDNPPLKIKSIILQQQSRNITTYLQAGKNYYLLMHNSTAAKPAYDLQQFEDSIPVNLPQLKIISFENVHSSVIGNKTIFSSTWIWAVIIAVLITLGFITFKLTKEMNTRT